MNDSMFPESFISSYLRQTRAPVEEMSVEPLGGDGSRREFWRVRLPEKGFKYIVLASKPADAYTMRENLSYLMIGKHLYLRGIPVPAIYRFNLEQGWFLMEDMGDKSLQEKVAWGEEPVSLYQTVLEHLFRLQTRGAEGFNPLWCCQTQRYDRVVMRRLESDYFRDSFLCGYMGMKKEWPELEDSFDHLAERSEQAGGEVFLHRDFQSRNLLVSEKRIGIIDWQGGRLGPPGYDLASLLIDPYAGLSDGLQSRLYRRYHGILENQRPEWLVGFDKTFPYLAIQRNLQILGAFGYLTMKARKAHFERYIPGALKSLHKLLTRTNDPKLDRLREVVEGIASRGGGNQDGKKP